VSRAEGEASGVKEETRKGLHILSLFLVTIEVDLGGHKNTGMFKGAVGEGFFNKFL
jgi:hypothetical protein